MTIEGSEATQNELKQAISRQEFVLHYQPEFDLSHALFDGVEALIRWRHPEKGLLLPAEFIPLAEKTRLIIQMGEWVLNTACKQNKIWQEKGVGKMRMAVNLSQQQLEQKKIVNTVKQALDEAQLDPVFLELEFIEDVIIHSDSMIKTIFALKDLGVQITLDDFGTGHSSLDYLKKIPVDRIKIPQTYIRNIFIDHTDEVIIKSIIQMAKELDIKVIAEGVEVNDQLQFLKEYSCAEVQGFYFCKPLPADELEQFLLDYKNSGGMLISI